jgi:hypothetical protein
VSVHAKVAQRLKSKNVAKHSCNAGANRNTVSVVGLFCSIRRDIFASTLSEPLAPGDMARPGPPANQNYHTGNRSPAEFGDLEREGEVVLFGAAGGCGPADVVEYPTVLEAIIGEPLDPAVAVEIDGDHAAVDLLLGQE